MEIQKKVSVSQPIPHPDPITFDHPCTQSYLKEGDPQLCRAQSQNYIHNYSRINYQDYEKENT